MDSKNLSILSDPFCDWLSFTLPFDLDKIELLIFGEKQLELKNWNSYTIAYFTSTSVLIAYNPYRPDLRIFVSLSSKALYSQQNSFENIIKWAVERNAKFTRIDIAKDDYVGLLDLNIIEEKIKIGHVMTRFRNYQIYENQEYTKIESGKIGKNESGKTIYIGNFKSDSLARIYDKGRKENKNFHWVRVEFQFRHSVADQYCNKSILIDPITGELKKGIASEKITLGNIRERDFNSIANYYLRFLDETRNRKNEIAHKRHWHTSKFWEKFIDTKDKNSIGLPKYKSGLEDLKNWATRSISGLNYLLEQAYGDDYKKERSEEGKRKFSENQYYQNLLRDKKNG